MILSLQAYHCRQWKSWCIYACLVAKGLKQPSGSMPLLCCCTHLLGWSVFNMMRSSPIRGSSEPSHRSPVGNSSPDLYKHYLLSSIIIIKLLIVIPTDLFVWQQTFMIIFIMGVGILSMIEICQWKYIFSPYKTWGHFHTHTHHRHTTTTSHNQPHKATTTMQPYFATNITQPQPHNQLHSEPANQTTPYHNPQHNIYYSCPHCNCPTTICPYHNLPNS